jgi:hypothetical protein
MLNKVIRDGRVAIVYSKHHGAGWSSWIDIEGIDTDPGLVELIERSAGQDEILTYCRNTWGTKPYYGGASCGLDIMWIPEGSEYIIDEYDGMETVRLKESFNWRVA